MEEKSKKDRHACNVVVEERTMKTVPTGLYSGTCIERQEGRRRKRETPQTATERREGVLLTFNAHCLFSAVLETLGLLQLTEKARQEDRIVQRGTVTCKLRTMPVGGVSRVPNFV